MSGPSPLTKKVAVQLRAMAAAEPSPRNLEAALRHLAKWRATLVRNSLRGMTGGVVRQGPFAGMLHPEEVAEGGAAPRLLGVYEASLHPVIETIIAGPSRVILVIGSAEGYYAVGLARRMPHARILARDKDPRARALCALMAEANGVAERVEIGGEVTHADLSLCAEAPTTIICDIEGAEEALLDPAAAPELRAAQILVEVHEGPRPGLTDRLAARFAASHAVTRLDRQLLPDGLPPETDRWSDLDRLLALWEWRGAATPWLWMVPNAP